jgi:hypothetical protein
MDDPIFRQGKEDNIGLRNFSNTSHARPAELFRPETSGNTRSFLRVWTVRKDAHSNNVI